MIHAPQGAVSKWPALLGHMLDEQPRLFFMHFWANDDATKLARDLRAALDRMATKTAGRQTGA